MASGWWDDSGAISGCVAAYAPIGAASLAASYSNLQNPGTYDAAPGVAPTFDTATGWTFNGSTQYLTTGVVPTAQGWSMLVRFTSPGTDVKRYIGGSYRDSGGNAQFVMVARHDGSPFVVYYGNGLTGSTRAVSPRANSGVLGIAGAQGYRDGVADGTAIPAGAPVGPLAVMIGAMNYNGTAIHHSDITVQAWAIYNATLTAGQVATLTTAMNALAASSSHPAILHAAQRAAFA